MKVRSYSFTETAVKLMIGIVLVCAVIVSSVSEVDRKVWSTCTTQNTSTGLIQTCRCGANLHGAIGCSDGSDTLQVQPCYCMFYEESENKTVAGNCMIRCYITGSAYFRSVTRYSIENGSLFNNDMCSSLMNLIDTHREGRFCGRCKKGFGLAVYSYHYTSCIPCENYSYKNWFKYFAISLLPVTVLYFIVVSLKINASSSRISGTIFALQCLVSPLQLRVIDGWMFVQKRGVTKFNAEFAVFNGFLGTIGIVNMDFLRTVYPFFCLHPKLNILHVVSLDLIVALYPFFLIFLTYVLISLHDKNFRLLLWAWKPFKWCLERYHRQFDVKGSLIETFATFILLSNVKILVVCIDLLLPTRVYDESGSQLNVQFLYYDANIGYFSSQHLPFALLALVVGFVFVFLPFLLLLLYPCRCFQQLLNALGWRCQVLHIFMDAFQGSYKTKPHDLRFFSAYYLLLRFLILFTVAYCTASVFVLSSLAFLLTLGGIVFAVFQPYKQHTHNRVDVVAIFVMVMLFISYSSNIVASALDKHWHSLSQYLVAISFVFIVIVSLVPITSFIMSSPKLSSIIAKVRSIASRKKKQRRDSSTSLLIGSMERENVTPPKYLPL